MKLFLERRRYRIENARITHVSKLPLIMVPALCPMMMAEQSVSVGMLLSRDAIAVVVEILRAAGFL